MGKSHKDPPAYHSGKSYSRWKTEVNLWADMVEKNKTVEKETIGQVVALNSLPDAQELSLIHISEPTRPY